MEQGTKLRNVCTCSLIFALLLPNFFVTACTQNSPSISTTKGPGAAAAFTTPTAGSTVSSFDLDSDAFALQGLAVGLQPFLSGDAPVLTWIVPQNPAPPWDYIQVIRCRIDVSIQTALETIPITDIDLSGMSDTDKANFYLMNDIFGDAESTSGCDLLTEGSMGTSFSDSFAPSGSYRYLVHTCINPKHLSNQKKLSGRTCSMRVAISSILSDYTNPRVQKENDYLKQAAYYSSQMDVTANTIKYLALGANDSINQCDAIEHQRSVNTAVRQAWVQLADAIFETAMDLKMTAGSIEGSGKMLANGKKKVTAGDILKNYNPVSCPNADGSKSRFCPSRIMQLANLGMNMQGMLFSQDLQKISASPADMPRSCTAYLQNVDDLQTLQATLNNNLVEYQIFQSMAQIADQGQLAIDGSDSDWQKVQQSIQTNMSNIASQVSSTAPQQQQSAPPPASTDSSTDTSTSTNTNSFLGTPQ